MFPSISARAPWICPEAGTLGTFQVDQAGDVVNMERRRPQERPRYFRHDLERHQHRHTVNIQNSTTCNSTARSTPIRAATLTGSIFQNGLILNGTVNLGGTSDLSSAIMAGYADFCAGNQDNSPETISGTGTIQLGQSFNGDALYNWGTLGTFTIGPHITILGGGPGSTAYFEQSSFTGSLDNQGTIEENGGSLQIDAIGPALADGESSSTTGWTNEGVIRETGATLSLLGGWINYGTISADSTSTVYLGNQTFGQTASSPNAPYYAWSNLGSLTIGNGATVIVGGFLTTDQYQGAVAIPGVTANLALDSSSLDGTLDNSAADNAVSAGVLALNAATGPLLVIGGTISGGSITTSGSDDIQVSTIPTGAFGAQRARRRLVLQRDQQRHRGCDRRGSRSLQRDQRRRRRCGDRFHTRVPGQLE